MNARRPLCWGGGKKEKKRKEMKNGIVIQTTSVLWNMLKFVVFPHHLTGNESKRSRLLSFFHSIQFHFISLSLFTFPYSYWLQNRLESSCFLLLFHSSVHIQNYTWDWLSEWVLSFFVVILWHTRFELDWITCAIFISGDWAFDIDNTFLRGQVYKYNTSMHRRKVVVEL